ncbi:MAG TPA: LPS assembly lipoprotein LptE [Elusimicrobiota bacterium]|nr:LPS assembly lipoprotein LptE [Elusimicrobiota bacterium]
MKRLAFLALAALSFGCASEDMNYQPAHQILPAHIKAIAVRPVVNKTQQFGLEDKLTLRIRDEFLRNGQYRVTPEDQADGVVVMTLKRYLLTPTQYDTVLTPTAYKLLVTGDLQFIDKTTNTVLWTEPNMQGVQTFTASTLSGGITEEQARELIWDVLARDIATRTIQGFGTASGVSQRLVPEPPQSQQTGPGGPPPTPVNANPY